MSTYNPYVAPQPQQPLQPPPWPPGGATNPAYAAAFAERYVPLGWRTALAAIAIASSAFFSLALDGVQLTMGDGLKGDDPALGPALLVFLSALAFLGSLIVGAIFFGIWIHRAARNLRGLGRTGMTFSPAACIGWYFVPFANLVRPVKAMSELWRASESGEDSDGYGWMGVGQRTGLIAMWWGAWLVGGVIGNVSGRVDDPATSGAIGLVGSLVTTVAAIACILLMRGVSARQSQAAERLAAAGAIPQPA
jgi:hypothetical protein